MSALSVERSGFLPQLVVSFATLLALFCLALVLAGWTWVVLAPVAEMPAAASPQAARISAAYAMFGAAPAQGEQALPTTIAITLLGTAVARPGRRGHALLQFGTQPSVVVREGEAVAPGILLQTVGPDRIVLVRAGIRETLAWPVPARAVAVTANLPGDLP